MAGEKKILRLPEALYTVDDYEVVVPEYLTRLSLPLIERSKTARKVEEQYPRIEVAGSSLRIGKTTAIRILMDYFSKLGLPVFFSPEDWRGNPYLEDSYQNKIGKGGLSRSEALAESQKWFIGRKFEQLRRIIDAVFIQDVSPLMDLGYAVTNAILGNMSEDDFKEYLVFCQTLDWSQVPAADLTLFLQASDEVLFERAESSKRKFEKFGELYIFIMAAVNKWLIDSVSAEGQKSILRIDTNENNFSSDIKAQDWLFSLIIKELASQDWPEMLDLLDADGYWRKHK